MRRMAFLILWLLSTPLAAEPVAEVQKRLDAAAAVRSDSREAALEQVLLLGEAEPIVADLQSAGPPQRKDALLSLPEVLAERAALRDAVAKSFALFCEGREPTECLLAEADALLAAAPELDNRTKWGRTLGQAAARSKSAVLLAEAGHFAEAEQMVAKIGPSFDRNVALGEVALLLARDGQVLLAFTLLEAVDEPGQLIDAIFDLLRPPRVPDERAVILDGSAERSAALAAVKRAAELASRLADAEKRDAGLFDAATLYQRLSEVEAATALHDQIHAGWLNLQWHCQLSYTQMKAGKFVGAERLAEKIAEADPEWEMPYLSLAAGLAAAGQFDEARRVAGRRPTPTGQVSSLVTVARASAPIDPDV